MGGDIFSFLVRSLHCGILIDIYNLLILDPIGLDSWLALQAQSLARFNYEVSLHLYHGYCINLVEEIKTFGPTFKKVKDQMKPYLCGFQPFSSL